MTGRAEARVPAAFRAYAAGVRLRPMPAVSHNSCVGARCP